MLNKKEVKSWDVHRVGAWLHENGFSEGIIQLFKEHVVDGMALLEMREDDLKGKPMQMSKLGEIKKLKRALSVLHAETGVIADKEMIYRGALGNLARVVFSLVYLGVASFATALTMTIVHAKVPDQENWPPLPDVILDNIPLIPGAFEAVEFISGVMVFIFATIILLHTHRLVVLARFNVIIGTVFLFRCVTMWVTSLSVPGHHLNCDQNQVNTSNIDTLLDHAWKITTGFGMATQGVRTCGDYLFSGHTIVLTMLNFAINEYTPSHWRGLHIASYVFNMFGMFLILAAHEHYTIDVIIAYYITSRMFVYYHTIANVAPRQGAEDKELHFSYFVFAYVEEGLTGVVLNHYQYPWEIFCDFCSKKQNRKSKKLL